MTETGYSLSDVAAVTRGNDDWGMNGGGFFWIFALLLLPMMMGGGFWGNNRVGEPVTESGLCNAMNFNNLENAVGRMSDNQMTQFTQLTNGICNLGYEQLRNTNETQRQLADCCCTTQRGIDGVNFNISQSTAAINANTTAAMQKILDQMCADKAAAQAQRIQQLELNQALCGVVRYPNAMTYSAGVNPFFGFNNCDCGCNCGCGNV